jgi:cytochrome P450
MFQAGTDTSSIVMEYAMAELMRKPQLMTKLQAEVRRILPRGNGMVTEDQLNSMPYLKAVLKETLRLHPPLVLFVPHLCLADCDIEGYTIPAGTRVIINGWAIGRDASSWERADEFEPERFMEGSSTATVDYNGNDFLLLPFGSGRRMCPGINFAISTMEIMLANLMYHFDWKLPDVCMDVDMTESFGVTVHRKEKLLLVPVQPSN